MDSKKSYHLLAFASKLMVIVVLFIFNSFNLIADNQRIDRVNPYLQQINKLKMENKILQQNLDSQNLVNEALIDENLILNRKNLNQELSIENRNFFIFTVLLFSFVALFLAHMLYRSIQKTKLNNLVLQQQNKEIENQKRELEDLNRLKIKFLSIISHDIRSPLLSLKGVLNLFDANLLNDKDELNAFFNQLNMEFNTTSSLLDNLLIWAKKQMYEESIEKVGFSINGLLNNILELKKAAIAKSDISIYNLLSDDIFVYADREMMNMVFRNLIGNALKFTPHGGQISIFYKLNEDELEIGVRDTGIGISREQVEKIYDANFYSTNGLNEEKGNGLGLMLCREFIEKNNGKLWIESKVGAGSTFFFTLPLYKDSHASISSNTTPFSTTT